jgi:hypothetical protein
MHAVFHRALWRADHETRAQGAGPVLVSERFLPVSPESGMTPEEYDAWRRKWLEGEAETWARLVWHHRGWRCTWGATLVLVTAVALLMIQQGDMVLLAVDLAILLALIRSGRRTETEFAKLTENRARWRARQETDSWTSGVGERRS